MRSCLCGFLTSKFVDFSASWFFRSWCLGVLKCKMDIVQDGDIFEDDLDVLEIIDHGFPRMRYVRSNKFDEFDELRFYSRFRLTKQSAVQLLIRIEHRLEVPDDTNDSVSPMNQLLTTLRFYASAGHLCSIADDMGMHASTVSRIIVRVSEALASLRNEFINMPQGDEDIARTQTEFYNIAHFPRVLGAVDGTHIKIQSPGGEDAEAFRNRKGYFSINVQVVGNANLKILDLVARWPGSAHDATILNNSRVRARFENHEFPNCLILGDSGYPLRPYILTPIQNPVHRAEHLYNESHIRTRNVIERLFGCWKRRFPVLAYGMRLKLDTVLTIIVATATVYNFAQMMNEPEAPPAEGINHNELQQLIEAGQLPDVVFDNPNVLVNQMREEFINNYFAHL